MRVPLLHGFAGDAAAWAATLESWRGAAELVPIALPGHGTPVAASWAANLEAIDLTGARVAVGYSFGARVALGLVAAGRLDRAVLIGVNPGIPDAERAGRRAADAQWAALLRDRGIAAFAEAWEAQPLFASQARVSRERLAERRARRRLLDPERLARCLEVMGLAEMPDYRAHLGRCHLIVGAEDAKFVTLGQGLPHELIADAGHDVPLEQPARLAQALLRLLE
jgi:2-succinyl-6-hydroxy-2,4-cyclohexadiene-1-carboxylate synthase